MVITKIEKQKRNRKRWSIFADGEFEVGISEETLMNFGLRVNDELSKETLAEMVEFDEYVYAKKCALDFLSYRVRSKREIKEKLISKNISPGTIERVMENLQKLGLIDDTEFARQLVQSYISEKPLGRKVIMQKLFQKGVPKQIGEKVLDDIFSSLNEKELAYTNFKKYFSKLRDKDVNTKKRKVFDFLARKGFDFEIINEIIKENVK